MNVVVCPFLPDIDVCLGYLGLKTQLSVGEPFLEKNTGIELPSTEDLLPSMFSCDPRYRIF